MDKKVDPIAATRLADGAEAMLERARSLVDLVEAYESIAAEYDELTEAITVHTYNMADIYFRYSDPKRGISSDVNIEITSALKDKIAALVLEDMNNKLQQMFAQIEKDKAEI